MGRKNTLKSYKMIDAADMSANVTSSTTSVINLDKASIVIAWSGSSPVGTLEVQTRNGEDDVWRALSFGTAIQVSGNSGDHRVVLNELPFTDVRVFYNFASGTGTLDAIITAKQTGG